MEYSPAIVSGSEEELWDLIAAGDGVFAFECRENPEIIIDEASHLLPKSTDLYGEWIDDAGNEFNIVFRGQETRLMLARTDADHSTIIDAMNRVLAGYYQVRIFRVSVVTDTLCCYVKPADWWDWMDNSFPERMQQVFVVFSPGVDIFANWQSMLA